MADALPGARRCYRVGGGGSTMSTMFADTLLIVFISVCTALLAEGEPGGARPAAPGSGGRGGRLWKGARGRLGLLAERRAGNAPGQR